MTTAWALPLALAAAVVLLATPIARRLALAVRLVDKPAPHKSHARSIPYLGGAGIAVAVLLALLAGPRAPAVGVVALCAAGLMVMGLVDDHRSLSPLVRLVVEIGCAAGAVAAGVRVTGLGVTGLDVAVTLVALVGIANAMNLMDNLDGLAAGVTAAGAAGVTALGILDGHPGLAAGGGALVGGCLGFLVFNGKPASIFMGDAGSLFLGFLLAALAVDASIGLPPSTRLLVPLLIVALPATDTTTVVLGRLRHRISPLRGGRDHLSHRLASTGMGSGKAVIALAATEAVLSGLAVAAGQGSLTRGWAALAGTGTLAAVVGLALRARAYRTPATKLPRQLWWVAGAAVMVAAYLALPAVVGALDARGPAVTGQAQAREGLAALTAGHLEAATADFASARSDLRRASNDLHWPLSSAVLAYPVLGSNLEAARTLASAGTSLASVGGQLASAGSSLRSQTRSGAVPVAALGAAAPRLRSVAASARAAASQLRSVDRAYLVPQLSGALATLDHQLPRAVAEAQLAAGAATELPPLLGAQGTRHYFLAVQNTAESRATGGFIGNWGELVANGGRLALSSFGRTSQLDTGGDPATRVLPAPPGYLRRYARFDPARTWQDVNMSPDFPTVGAVIASLYPQSGGEPVDGVVAVDPVGLAGILRITGPITVPGWPVAISSANVVPVTLHDAYLAFPDEARRASFLGDVAHGAFDALSRASLGSLNELSNALGPAVRQHHLQIYATRPAEEAYLRQWGAAGAFPPVRSDSLAVTTQNSAANKIDYYLRRQLTYSVRLRPGAVGRYGPTIASATGKVTETLDNTAPPDGLPALLIGPYGPGFRPGENRSFLTVYSPLGFTNPVVNGRPADLESSRELGRQAYSTYVDIPAQSTATVGAGLGGTVALLPGGWYQLSLPAQPLVVPEQASVSISLAPGWQVAAARGATIAGPSTVRATLGLDTSRSIWVRMAKVG